MKVIYANAAESTYIVAESSGVYRACFSIINLSLRRTKGWVAECGATPPERIVEEESWNVLAEEVIKSYLQDSKNIQDRDFLWGEGV